MTSAPIPSPSERDIKRFWSNIDMRTPNECWVWLRATDKDGYGWIGIKYRMVRTHRFAYYLHTGKDPLLLQVMHSCDNPPCCNPSHLTLGTNRDNVNDMARKHRLLIGEKNHSAKLNKSKVVLIRTLFASGISISQLARDFSVDRKTLRQAATGATWKHV